MCSIYSRNAALDCGGRILSKYVCSGLSLFFKQLVFIFECDAGRGRNARTDQKSGHIFGSVSVHIFPHFPAAGQQGSWNPKGRSAVGKNSSSRHFRISRPIRVMRGSSPTVRGRPILSAFCTMVRNLKMRKSCPAQADTHLPVKTQARGESSLMASASRRKKRRSYDEDHKRYCNIKGTFADESAPSFFSIYSATKPFPCSACMQAAPLLS